MARLALAFALLAGCAQGDWLPDSAPVDVAIIGSDHGHLDEIRSATDELDAALGHRAFVVVRDSAPACGRINVWVDVDVPTGADGVEDSVPCMARVHVRPQPTGDFRVILMHELGHALGLTHSANPYSIMADGSSGIEYVTDADAEAMRERLGLE